MEYVERLKQHMPVVEEICIGRCNNLTRWHQSILEQRTYEKLVEVTVWFLLALLYAF